MISVSTRMSPQEVRDLSEVREKPGKMKVEKSGHPGKSLW